MKDKPDPVDVHVGGRVRLRRTLLGMSQEKLGEAINLTFQQIQKYERGTNRIGASRLYQLSQVLDVSVQFFYDGLIESASPGPGAGYGMRFAEPEKTPYEAPPSQWSRRETLELVRAYYRISDIELRSRVFDMVKSIAGAGDGPDIDGEAFGLPRKSGRTRRPRK